MFRLADLADAILDTAGEPIRLRLVFEFLRGAGEDGHRLQSLVGAEPVLTGIEHFDALLAAIAEDLCVNAGIRPPDWVHDDSRFLDWTWWVSDLRSAKAEALIHTPAPYRRRVRSGRTGPSLAASSSSRTRSDAVTAVQRPVQT